MKKQEIFMAFYVLMLLVLLPPPASTTLTDQGKALLSIKSSFKNVANILMDWDDDVNNADYCSWKGVFCADNLSTSVVSLNLSNLNLGGEISTAIGDLRDLQSIDLQGNKLTGQIPDELGNCVSLVYLDLSDNLLYGDIPFSISKLRQLELLNLKNNQFTGPIPATLTQMPNLKTLDLAQNQLTGAIPSLIYWNEVLQYLGLRGNSLTGSLSPDMCQLTGLWYFDVRHNYLTGPIPNSIGNCTSFEILDISYNEITGEIPYNIGFLQVATLSLQGNKLTGKIPEVIGLMQALAVLDLSDNELVGSIPPILGNLSYTGKLYLHGNKLTGPIPPELGNMSRLSYLQLNDNQLVGGIPAELGKLEQLFELNLAKNNLEGPIPQNISSCTSLNQFNVHGNRLNGSIPLSFRNLESLTYLNLSSNQFKGGIPVELGRIINLDTLDLSNNNFSGHAPASIGDLEHLLTLNLSCNHLDGPLPAEFGNLRSIVVIDMSFNNISGGIPGELGQLQNVVSLILNNNNMDGKIPDQLTKCFSLATMNISYNNFSGVLPVERNFSRFSPDSYNGNPFLCGNWLGSICDPYARKSKVVFSRIAVVCISLGTITLLSTVIVALYKSNQPKQFMKQSNRSVRGPPKLVPLHKDMAIHTYEDIMRITENLSEKYIIGYGASSNVYKCVLKNSRPMAIKRVYTQYTHNLQEFETELGTIGSIKHRNLVSLHGYSLSPQGNLLVYDYMENGSLWDLLHGPLKKVKLDWGTRLKIAVGAAQGLAYLHHDCTIGYIDPEYARTSRLTEKSDVYSFGIVLLELLTGRKAVDNEANLHHLILSKADNDTVMDAVDPEVTLTCTDISHVKKTFQLALLCTKQHPSERPTMHDVTRILLSMLPAPVPKLCTPHEAFDYAQFVMGQERSQLQPEQQQVQPDDVSSDAQWFLKFQELASKHTS
ncbi:LRR receptor-like serine/threonine-protein kinase ERL1 [Heracleum sosnowskyi]|uniref:LRR receptor-like serine/threonine-protein kinase ERL1 n=1 Tax=Heracleum sosnowskyi TaxID=360622 RepID=A0AAD8N2R3_9APIA|nr:LRR receptor-like serine/threonine-protein kinase ERL1 [Heracleum sosnowskyi]